MNYVMHRMHRIPRQHFTCQSVSFMCLKNIMCRIVFNLETDMCLQHTPHIKAVNPSSFRSKLCECVPYMVGPYTEAVKAFKNSSDLERLLSNFHFLSLTCT